MQYEVTIGIPVYHIERYVARMMESALAQTFPSIEFLVIDDCGTDGSIDIIRQYQQSHARGKDIRIVRQPKNMGVGMARNRIIDEARGKYLYCLDGDDSIMPDTIRLLYDNATQYQAQIVYASHVRVEEYGDEVREIPFRYPSLQFLQADEFAEWAYGAYGRIPATTWNYLIDINVYRQNHLRVQPVNYWEDFSFTMDLPTYITRAVLLPDITYRYYCRAGSLSNFQKRSHIDKAEIERTIQAVNQNKQRTDSLRQKSYFPGRMYKLMATDFYIVCTVLSKKQIISPRFSHRELRDVMQSPLSLSEILRFRQFRWANLLFYLFSKLPPSWSVGLMYLVGKMKRII